MRSGALCHLNCHLGDNCGIKNERTLVKLLFARDGKIAEASVTLTIRLWVTYLMLLVLEWLFSISKTTTRINYNNPESIFLIRPFNPKWNQSEE